MPGGDGTGPAGMGPMTGRAAGFCAGYSTPGYMNPVPGRGFGAGFGRGMGFGRGRGFFGRGRGGGFGWRNQYYATGVPGYARYGAYPPPATYQPPQVAPEDEKTYLENEMKYLQEEVDTVKKRLGELKSTKKS